MSGLAPNGIKFLYISAQTRLVSGWNHLLLRAGISGLAPKWVRLARFNFKTAKWHYMYFSKIKKNFLVSLLYLLFIKEEARWTTIVVRLDRNCCYCLDAPQIWNERVSTHYHFFFFNKQIYREDSIHK